jgi:hypothetical protein
MKKLKSASWRRTAEQAYQSKTIFCNSAKWRSTMHRNLFFLITSVFITFTLIECTRNTLDTYKPKSLDEEEIIKVLKKNHETVQNKDRAGHLATFHDNASIMVYNTFDNTPMISKNEYDDRLPGLNRWGRDGDVISFREIIVTENTATIKGVFFTSSNYKAQISYIMVKENSV